MGLCPVQTMLLSAVLTRKGGGGSRIELSLYENDACMCALCLYSFEK